MQENNTDEPEFTDEQLRAALKRVGETARDIAFAAGRPVYIAKGDRLFALFSDGTEKLVETTSVKTDGNGEFP